MFLRLILPAIWLASASAALAQDLSALIARVAPAVVVIADEGAGHGSGFAVSADGILVTNLHVVARMKQPRVTLANGAVFTAVSVLAYDRDRDLAILKIPASGLRSLAFGDSGKVAVGQRVIAFGTPLGLAGTATAGIVSAIRGHPKAPGGTLLQTDAAINPGSSGGPLVNANGDVVGVVVSVIREAQNLGFAVPVNDVRALLRSTEHSFTLDEVRRYLLQTDWAPSVLPRRWRAAGDFHPGSAVYELDGGDRSMRFTFLRPAAETQLGSRLMLSLLRNGPHYEGLASGQVNCETLRESRKLPWLQEAARVSLLSLERIEITFFAPSPPDAEGDCQLKFRQYSLSLVPAGELESTPATGEAEYLESIRSRRVVYQQRRERLRGNCVEVRAKLARDCAQVTQWNASSCKTYEELAAVCTRESF